MIKTIRDLVMGGNKLINHTAEEIGIPWVLIK